MQLYFIQSVTFRTSKQKHGQEKKIIIIAIYTTLSDQSFA